MTAGGCEDDLQAELPALLSALHAGDATAIRISHHVETDGDCRFTIEVIRPDPGSNGETHREKTWEYRWP